MSVGSGDIVRIRSCKTFRVDASVVLPLLLNLKAHASSSVLGKIFLAGMALRSVLKSLFYARARVLYFGEIVLVQASVRHFQAKGLSRCFSQQSV